MDDDFDTYDSYDAYLFIDCVVDIYNDIEKYFINSFGSRSTNAIVREVYFE